MSSSPQPQSRRPSAMAVLLPVVLLLAAMWLLEIADFLLPVRMDYWGITSREVPGLLGIPMAPFLHGGFDHLIANTLPFLILGSLVAWRVGGRFWGVLLVIIVVGGFGVWLLGPGNAITIGASGVVFGFLGYLLAAGVLTRNWVDILVAVAVFLIYGSMLWGALPFGVPSGVSWLAHLTGAAAGVAAAFVYARPRSVPAGA